jgi:Xaa-Pro aminopeptidase
MPFRAESINTPISTQELDRRWAAVRAVMQAHKIDALIMQNTNDHMGGYVRYFTDNPATNGYPVTVIFPADDRMSVICQGTMGVIQPLPPEGDGLRRGVKQVMTTSLFVNAPYTLHYDAEMAEKALAPYATKTIGLLGQGTLPVFLIDHLRRAYPKARFVDASDLVDRITSIKSPEEQALIARTATAQDAAMKAVVEALHPGLREHDASAIAEHAIHNAGGEQGIYLTASQPGNVTPGDTYAIGGRHTQNRTLQKGDVFSLLIETNGPGGMYAELGRTLVLGKAPQELKDELAFLLEARQYTLSLLKPGAACKDIWDSYNAYMRQHGKPEEKRLYCHGQGYDLVERPLVRFDEPMPIQAGMNLACHPTWLSSKYFNSPTDNFIIGPNGPTGRVHKYPEIIIEVDC